MLRVTPAQPVPPCRAPSRTPCYGRGGGEPGSGAWRSSARWRSGCRVRWSETREGNHASTRPSEPGRQRRNQQNQERTSMRQPSVHAGNVRRGVKPRAAANREVVQPPTRYRATRRHQWQPVSDHARMPAKHAGVRPRRNTRVATAGTTVPPFGIRTRRRIVCAVKGNGDRRSGVEEREHRQNPTRTRPACGRVRVAGGQACAPQQRGAVCNSAMRGVQQVGRQASATALVVWAAAGSSRGMIQVQEYRFRRRRREQPRQTAATAE